MKKEKWKNIDLYKEFYQVSNHGRIRSKPRYRSNGKAWYLYQGKILKGSPNPKGYLVIRTSIDGAKFSLKIHREVAKAFKSNKKNNPEVNHKDGNKINNYYENLEWVTSSENALHRDNVLGVGNFKTYKRDKKGRTTKDKQ